MSNEANEIFGEIVRHHADYGWTETENLEYFCNTFFYFRGRDNYLRRTAHVGIPDSCKHIRNGIGHGHDAFLNFFWMYHQLDLITPGSNPNPAFLRKQIRHIQNFRK